MAGEMITSSECDTDMALNQDDESKVKNLDYVRFVWSDLHGISRSKLVPSRHVSSFLKHGISVYHGNQVVGPRSQTVVFDEVEDWFGNCLEMPDVATLHVVPWACQADNDVKIGQVLCLGKREDNMEPLAFCPRGLLLRLTNVLKTEFGLEMMSGCEHEFLLLNKNTLSPVTEGNDIFCTIVLSQFEKFFTNVERQFCQVGVDIESILPEYQCGQFELVTHATLGMQAVDASFLLKTGLKEMSRQEGYMATFMTRPSVGNENACSSSTHFNISLWQNGSNNVFNDDSDPNKMSSTFKHWLSGLILHARAITALCCPTVNCYRRLHQPWAPHDAKWGMDNRVALLRVRRSNSGSFVELRLPSAASNPYLVASAVIAAGMDGLRRTLELPPEMDEAAVVLPYSLEEALQALEGDNVMVEALGSQFVTVFCQMKREIEIEALQNIDLKAKTGDVMDAEHKMYLEYI